MSGPLSGIKVIELAAFVAAPTVGRLMADMGADVIKVESAGVRPAYLTCPSASTKTKIPFSTFTTTARSSSAWI